MQSSDAWPAAYYNELDFDAAEWLRTLIDLDAIENGHVDPRNIAEVRPEQIEGYLRCHFFAGIGGWDYALRRAGWPEPWPIWTASLPCQPFSAAGKRRGIEDERHLWPVFRDLVKQCRPPVVVGEQVASKAGREWLAAVFANLEDLGYAVAGADLCAAGIGAPHIRQRLYWAAIRCGWQPDRMDRAEGIEDRVGLEIPGRQQPGRELFRPAEGDETHGSGASGELERSGGSERLGYARRTGSQGHTSSGGTGEGEYVGRAGIDDGLAHAQYSIWREVHERRENGRDGQDDGRTEAHCKSGPCSEVCGMADADGRHACTERQQSGGQQRLQSQSNGRAGGLGDASSQRRQQVGSSASGDEEAHGRTGWIRGRSDGDNFPRSAGADHWSDVVYLPCLDNKVRPIPDPETQPGLFPLVDGIPEDLGCGVLNRFSSRERIEENIAETIEATRLGTQEGRIMRLRGYGNAIVPALAATFVSSVMDLLDS